MLEGGGQVLLPYLAPLDLVQRSDRTGDGRLEQDREGELVGHLAKGEAVVQIDGACEDRDGRVQDRAALQVVRQAAQVDDLVLGEEGGQKVRQIRSSGSFQGRNQDEHHGPRRRRQRTGAGRVPGGKGAPPPLSSAATRHRTIA